MASTTGKYVSTSAIAKQFLESAREDRLEMVDLLAHPTDTLLEIRRKGDAQHLLSRAEWQVLAHFVRHGVEARSSLTPNPVSRDSFLALLDAFLAVYDLRTEGTAQRDAWYVGNLPSECRPTTATRSGRFGHVTPDVVRQTVTETRRRVSDLTMHAIVCTPLMAGRNLSVLLEDEPLAGLEAVNRALRPYWAALWRLAARGHYVVTREPVREQSPQRRAIPAAGHSVDHRRALHALVRPRGESRVLSAAEFPRCAWGPVSHSGVPGDHRVPGDVDGPGVRRLDPLLERRVLRRRCRRL